MPVSSRPETLLVRRQNESDNVQYPFSSSQDSVLTIALPFYDAIVDMTGKSRLVDNIFIKTVICLKNIKEKEGLDEKKTIDYISDRTCLNQVVIKAILKKYSNNIDVQTGEISVQRELHPAHVLFNPLVNDYIIESMDDQTFQKWSYINPTTLKINYTRHELQYGISIGRRSENAYILGTGNNEGSPYETVPAPTERMPARVIDLLKNRLERKIDDEKALGIEDTLQRNPVWLICHLYVDENDLSDIQILSPLTRGNSKPLIDLIRDAAEKYPEENVEIVAGIRRLEKIRNQHLDNAVTFELIKQESARNTLALYPGLKNYPKVANKISTFMGRFPETFGKSNDETPVWPDRVRAEITVAFYSAMEDLFTQAVESLFPREDDNQVEKIHDMARILGSRTDNRRSYKSLLSPIAQRVGFADRTLSDDFFDNNSVRARDISKILKLAEERTLVDSGKNKGEKQNSQYQYRLTELIIATMIEADNNPNHPFRMIAPKCPNLFQAMKVKKTSRDLAKHDDDKEQPPVLSVSELYVMKALLEMCIGLISDKVSQLEKDNSIHAMDGKIAAEIKADEQLRKYEYLSKHPDLSQYAKTMCSQYFYKYPDYYSSCYNLLDHTIYEAIIYWDSGMTRGITNKLYSGDKVTDWEKASKLFEKYGFTYSTEAELPGTRRLVEEDSDLHLLPLRTKLMMMFAVFDIEHPELLINIADISSDIVELCIQASVKRGHNDETVFSDNPNEIEEFHTNTLKACNQICKMILEDDKNG